MRSHRKGFTLVELLVVITIILIMVSLLVVLIKGVVDNSRNARTYAFIKGLDMACQNYHRDYGVFPPPSGTSSIPLHQYLGAIRKVRRQLTTNTAEPAMEATLPPAFEFKEDQLRLGAGVTSTTPTPAVVLMDYFGNDIRYRNQQPAPTNHMNKKGIDIWSPGKDGLDDVPTATQTDDINNWNKDR